MNLFINKYVAEAYCVPNNFLSAWDKSVKKNLDKDLCPYGDRKDRLQRNDG